MSEAARALSAKELTDALVERINEAVRKAGHQKEELEAMRNMLVEGHAKFRMLSW